jgi:adenylate cyclase
LPSASLKHADELSSRALTLANREPYTHCALAIISLYMRKHELAIREAEFTISLDPNLALGYETLGTALHYSGRSAEALVCFERAMAQDPYFPDLWLHFQAQAMFQLGRYEEAADCLRRRLVRKPDTDSSRVLLAASYGHLGRVEEARSTWQEALTINPHYTLSHRREVLPYKNPDDFELIVDFARAGSRRTGNNADIAAPCVFVM